MKLPVVAIIGRPNVGKSTLFNCFFKARKAIVSDIPGTTRDSLMEKIQGDNYHYLLVDTAGLTDQKGEALDQEVQLQADIALQNADVILFLVDGRKEITSDDEKIVQKLRKSKKSVIFTVNKIDDGNTDRTLELAKFGFGVPIPISAKNRTGLWELEDAIEEALSQSGFKPYEEELQEAEEEKDGTIRIAFVGRPNVGKSSLLNALIKSERSVVSDTAGTTRDTIDVDYEDEQGNKFLLLDTAGLKRPGKTFIRNNKDEGRLLEFWGSVRSREAIEQADICVLLIDALDGVTHQDLAIAGKIVEAGKGVIIGVNKFDLVQEKSRAGEESDTREVDEVKMWGEELDSIRKNYLSYLSEKISFIRWAPVLFFSAKTKKGIEKIFESALGIYQERERRVPTTQLNQFVPEIFFGHVQPSSGTKHGKIKYASQVDTHPPKFLFFVNNVQAFHFSYRRYIENKLREKWSFFGTPIKIELRDAMKEEQKSRRKKK